MPHPYWQHDENAESTAKSLTIVSAIEIIDFRNSTRINSMSLDISHEFSAFDDSMAKTPKHSDKSRDSSGQRAALCRIRPKSV